MESKYYTPTIEEFHVGFEYQTLIQEHDMCVWYKVKVNSLIDINDVFDIYNGKKENNTIRVKYLDKEDIESFGFKITELYGFVKDKWCILLRGEHRLEIVRKENPVDVIFYGTIKNKSELKGLLKQLGIDEKV